jgi:hypothetical protein
VLKTSSHSAIFKIIDFYKHGSKILKDLWNLLEIVIITFFLVCTAMYITRWLMINKALGKFAISENSHSMLTYINTFDPTLYRVNSVKTARVPRSIHI